MLIGIGGSALGPQLVNDAFCKVDNPLDIHFVDNTDPDGIAKVVSYIPDLSSTLVIVVSKSGGTKETKNGLSIVSSIWQSENLTPTGSFIAITGEDSDLDELAKEQNWLKTFYIWDWVGGRTSLWSPVGLLPAALQGFNVESLLKGASDMDEITRNAKVEDNPAMLMALSWYFLGNAKGEKAMVILPYKDRLAYLGKYLQQLVMESLGKEEDNDGNVVNQGLSVFGNKGSTDQHAYVQQLRDGLNNFFVVFLEVLNDSSPGDKYLANEIQVDYNITAGDYLNGFYQGTRKALHENGRKSLTLSLDELTEYSLGMILALFERSVGFYATMININAYNQPGVEAGKKAATNIIETQMKILDFFQSNSGSFTAEQVSESISEQDQESVFRILRHLSANNRISVEQADDIFDNLYSALKA